MQANKTEVILQKLENISLRKKNLLWIVHF